MKNAIAAALCGSLVPLLAVQGARGQPAGSAWPLPGRDAGHTYASPYKGPGEPAMKWSYIGAAWTWMDDGEFLSGLTIGKKEQLYLTLEDSVSFHCLDSAGSFSWSYVSTGYDISSPAAVRKDGSLYIAVDDGLHCINSDGSSIVWSYITGSDVFSDPVIGEKGKVYFGSDDNRLYSLNADGTLSWSYATGGTIAPSPALGPGGTVYANSDDDRTYCLSSGGAFLWSYASGAGYALPPSVDALGRVYTISSGGPLYCLNSNGTLSWSSPGPYGSPRVCAPAGIKGNVYLTHWNEFSGSAWLLSFDQGGSLLWSYAGISGNVCKDPDGRVYGVGFNAPSQYVLYSLHSSGRAAWSYNLPPAEWMPLAPVIGSDGTLYVGGHCSAPKHDDTVVYAFGEAPPTPTPYPEPWLGKVRYGPVSIWINGLLPPGPWGPLGPFPPEPEPYSEPGLNERLSIHRYELLEALTAEESPAGQRDLEREIVVLELGMELIYVLETEDHDYADQLGRRILMTAIEKRLEHLEDIFAAAENQEARERLQVEMELFHLDMAFIRAERDGDRARAKELVQRIAETEARL